VVTGTTPPRRDKGWGRVMEIGLLLMILGYGYLIRCVQYGRGSATWLRHMYHQPRWFAAAAGARQQVKGAVMKMAHRELEASGGRG